MQEIRVRSLGWEDSLGEGNGNPLQYSCLGNPMDRETRSACITLYYSQSPGPWKSPIPDSTGKIDSPEAAEILKTQLQSLVTQHLCTEVLVSYVRLGTPRGQNVTCSLGPP